MRFPQVAGLLLAFVARLVTGAQGRWIGTPPKAEQRIYFANHQSHFDWVLIWAALPHELRATTRPIAARDYWTASPLKHWITREIFNAVYVTRPKPKPPVAAEAPKPPSATEAPVATADTVVAQGAVAVPVAPTGVAASAEEDPLEPLLEALAHGDSLVIFPEGTRGHTGVPASFKSGLYALARAHPEVVLVPVWIDNVQRVMPKGEVVPVPVLCTVSFGAPIALGAGEDRRVFLDRARAAVMALAPPAPRR